ncbi:PepSY domain-containing protein [Streptomyces ficellus]|uniref:PepSY domain-containing protein n=1 Tax=Streptomyces ficellus TaxID=1977088 RepID=A0ABT7Z4M2_9ACTN|nr:PepSY domain-containing protein [Streptomyces ficellus]MDN3294454.1 PepSY domain-containing protein [Streptomyces ficellus]
MKRNLIIATVTTAALLTGGTAAAFASSGDDEAPQAVKTTTVTAEQALKAVSPHGTVVSLDLEDKAWDVEVVTKDGKIQEWNVDAKTAKATQDTDQDDSDD